MSSIEHNEDCRPEHMSAPDEEGVRDCSNCGLFEFPHFTSFKLELDGGNTEMRTFADVARALRSLADKLDDESALWGPGYIHDSNGNTIGAYTWH